MIMVIILLLTVRRTSGNKERVCSNGQYVSELAEQPKNCRNRAWLLVWATTVASRGNRLPRLVGPLALTLLFYYNLYLEQLVHCYALKIRKTHIPVYPVTHIIQNDILQNDNQLL